MEFERTQRKCRRRSSRGGGTTNLGLGEPGTFAERQLQRERQELAARRREDQLRAENARLLKELSNARNRNPEVREEEMDEEEGGELSDDDKGKNIENIRNGLPYLIQRFGEESSEVAKAKADAAALERALRDSKPYKTHRAQLEKKKERLERQQVRGREEADELLVEIERLQARLNAANQANDQRAKDIAAVDDELRELLKKALAEGEGEQLQANAQTTTPPDPTTAWNTVTSTLAGMAAQPGVPEAWAVQMSNLLEQVRLAASTLHQHSTAAAQSQLLHQTQQHPQPQGAGIGVTGGGNSSDSSSGDGGAGGGSSSVNNSATPPKGDTPASPTAATMAAGATAAAESTAESTATGTPIPASESPGEQPTATGEISDLESDDDMESIQGEAFDLRDGETDQQRKKRIKMHLFERQRKRAEAKEAKRKERLAGKKGGAGGTTGNISGTKPPANAGKKK